MSLVVPRQRRLTAGILRALEFVAYPALAGAAFCVLSLGVVTWLPALAATAAALRQWRADHDSRCFTGVFAAFPRYWRGLWRHGLVSTVVITVLVANVVFLAGEPAPAAFAMLAAQVGIGLALVPYHLALAATAAVTPEADPATWRRSALALAFGSATHGVGLLAVTAAATLATIPIPLGPLLLGPTLPLLYALHLADHL